MWPVTDDTHTTGQPINSHLYASLVVELRPKASYRTGWCRWASLWWWSPPPSGCWRTGRWRGCSSWGPAWTGRACSGWWGAGWCRWCPGRPDAAPPRCAAYFCCPADLRKSGTRERPEGPTASHTRDRVRTDPNFWDAVRRADVGTWPVVCRGWKQIPHLGILQTLHPLDIQSAKEGAAGGAERRDCCPGASRQQQDPQTLQRRRNTQSIRRKKGVQTDSSHI